MPRDVEPAGRFGRDFMATRPPPSDDSDTASKHSHAIPRRRARYSRYAKATFKKDRRLNIRLSSKDLEAIQKRALAEGLPYQTLIASLLHKYAAGCLKEI
jgi:predicted DNA binding CopG/RHH family protein